MKTIRIGTRKSPLALWQAEYVRTHLLRQFPHIQVELVKMTTQGDIILDTPLAKVGGCRVITRQVDAPIDSADSTNADSRRASVCARTIRCPPTQANGRLAPTRIRN